MPAHFIDHPSLPGVRRWRRSRWGAIGLGAALLLFAVLLVGASVALGIVLSDAESLARTDTTALAVFAVGFLLLIATLGGLSQWCWRDLRGRLGTAITLDDTGITLQLPRGRSLIHDPPAADESIPWAAVEGIETRDEYYGAQGMAMINRVYRLRRVASDPIFLFEQRGLDSTVQSEAMDALAAEIAQRAGVVIESMGNVEGRGGLLGMWGATAPPWTAADLPPRRLQALQRRVQFTAIIAGGAMAVALLVRLVFAAA